MTDQQLYQERRCYVCQKTLPDGGGFSEWWAFFCSDCYPRANALRKNRDRSPRGRYRPVTEWKQLLHKLRREMVKQ